ncbi:hypothetical protein BKA58DRAFT_320584 [Alternaria rosae]|uniref:uncharacterized protein n=1 Tax=Alternaria rosae TaxID=1187941 RepID=UPI001E8CDA1F|nr:uncharacterized protein BKA58DRAFT_320584 [Alternaria rosae]KAH6865548.1 hypothetical protein BKA58DRAFT_320584 [Alternaria rosae]
MSKSTSSKLANLRGVLARLPDKDVLHKFLGNSTTAPGLLREAVLVVLHRKWSANPPYRLTELGITTYDRSSIKQGQPIMAGPHAEDLLRQVWCLHLVIRSTAHLDSTDIGLERFHFGTTVYVTQEEALFLLQHIWHQPMNEQNEDSGYRPIIYMSFGSNSSISKVRKVAFDFDPFLLSTTVAALDAQIIPQQSKITRHADADYAYLLKQFNVPVYHSDNSGNAAMYATVVAILSALRFELYGSPQNAKAKPGQIGQSSSKSAAFVVQSLMNWPTPAPPVSVEVFCWRCGSGEHGFLECANTDLKCGRCEGAAQEWRRMNAGTHMEGSCAFGPR